MRRLFCSFVSKKILFVLILIVGTFVSSCSNLISDDCEQVEIVFPQWEENFPYLCGWDVKIQNAFDSFKVFVSPGENLSFLVKLNRPVAFVACPVTYDAAGNMVAYFYPAGFVYPYGECAGSDKNKVILTWNDGFTAEVMNQMFTVSKNSGYLGEEVNEFIASFNWKRLMLTVQNKETEDEMYNPWLLERNEILNAIAYRNFKATDLNLKKSIVKEYFLEGEFFLRYVPVNSVYFETGKIYLNLEQVYIVQDLMQNFYKVSTDLENNVLLDKVFMPILE